MKEVAWRYVRLICLSFGLLLMLTGHDMHESDLDVGWWMRTLGIVFVVSSVEAIATAAARKRK